MDFEPTWRISFEPSAPRTISCHKTMVAWFFFFSYKGGTATTFSDFDTFGVPLIGVSSQTSFFILFWSKSFLWTWFWVSNWSFWNYGSFGSQFASRSCLWYLLKCPWIKFEVNKSCMYIKHSNNWELSQIGMLMVKDTAALNSGDKEATSSQNVKVKVTKNVTESSVTIVTVFV